MQIQDPRPGTYALILHSARPHCAVVGRLGRHFLPTGYWIYVGSAFGPGGLRSRLDHHLHPSSRPHWHLDYIKTAMQPMEAWTTTDAHKREHDWATVLATIDDTTCPIPGFGASDCNCAAHLFHMPRRPVFQFFSRLVRHTIGNHAPILQWVNEFT